MNECIEEILEFWFEGKTDHDQAKGKENPYRKWFRGGPELDAEITRRFSADIEKALQGQYDEWKVESKGSLALILLLDQFTRNAFRGTPRAYSGDEKAVALALSAIDQQFEKQLSYLEKVFLYMPLMHSENVDVQRQSVKMFDKLVTKAKISYPYNSFLFENNLRYAKQHCDDIVRFGRFPYRNDVLGRESTDEEKQYLLDH